MTVHTLATPLQYPAPDLNKIKNSRAEISYKIRTLSTLYLPVLVEELKALQNEINTTDKSALDALTLAPIALNHEEIKPLYSAIQKLEKNNTITEQEQKEAMLSYAKDIKLIIDDGRSKMKEHTDTLENSLTNLRKVELSDNQYRIEELKKSIESDSPKLAAERKAIELLETQETALNTAIGTLESSNVFDLLKDVLLSVEKLTETDMATPKIALVKVGISAAGKILGVASDALKYEQLITARKTVQDRLDMRRTNIESYNNDIKTTQERVDQLTEFQTVQPARAVYIQEFDTLAEAMNRFLTITAHEATDDLSLVVKNFVEQSNVFIPFIKSLRQQWSV
ncbi:alpha-xenorhabdolysin family binary toxin subunit B [Pseudomonas fluorescens]|uniref:Binary cytotoxin component n=1 Tax=Pseudomonas fluorescens TaxID=294 RepID=A0A5E6ZSZ2_PSEFL|nr:alpha-xenorhabdolysin family binary toxin subunit B [Pseudomonas fluorescens]VVN69630.1 hypothetical protein PS723_00313 [Pseudomonas fluorescens]